MYQTILKSVLFFILTTVAHAEQIPLTSITSDAEPGMMSHLGVVTDESNSITKVFYENGVKETKFFNEKELLSNQVLFTKKGYEVAYIKSKKFNPMLWSLALTFKKDVRKATQGSNIGTRYFWLVFNPKINHYQILDENRRPFTSAHATAHHAWAGLFVTGIEAIHTR